MYYFRAPILPHFLLTYCYLLTYLSAAATRYSAANLPSSDVTQPGTRVRLLLVTRVTE